MVSSYSITDGKTTGKIMGPIDRLTNCMEGTPTKPSPSQKITPSCAFLLGFYSGTSCNRLLEGFEKGRVKKSNEVFKDYEVCKIARAYREVFI